ncbi:DUF2490 domain-containing protein [Aestuariivivens sediminis]|uniref:DUF2490 domain-containing protein n=1 Tax=Aestuariivivens sediminis TaxID=2913557 RepID=UPI001F566C47|nr:DUF2490 domain-containing protein [Aestuariivivens sediminis]
MKNLVFVLGFVLTFCISHAQLNPEDKLGISYEFGITHKISENFSISTYSLLWLYEVNDNFNFILLNAGLNYQITPHASGSISYGYSDYDGTIDISSPHTLENRISEHIVYKHHLIKVPLEHRFKVEHRFLRTPTSKQTVTRFRYRIATQFKLSHALFIYLKNEWLLSPNLSNTPENRFNGGLGIHWNKSSTVLLGYFNRNTMNRMNLHRLQVGLFIKTDWRKK